MMTMIVMIMIAMMIIMAMIMMVTMSMMMMSMISIATMMMIMISMMMVMTSSSYLKVLMEDTTVHHGIMKRQIDSETRALVLVSGSSEVDG